MDGENKNTPGGLNKQTKTVDKTPAEWAKELRTKPHYVAGVKMFAGWKDDQKISKSEFERKLNEWLKRPVGNKASGGRK